MQNDSFKHQIVESVQDGYTRRLMCLGEIEETFSLIDGEGWKLTLAKFKQLFKVFPSSIFVTVEEETQGIVAAASIIPTFPSQYIVGNLVVRSDHRSRGQGKALLLHLLNNNIQHTGPFTATLTSVPGAYPFYSKLGFQAIEPSHSISHVMVDRPGVNKALGQHKTDGVTISKYSQEKFEALNDYDTSARGYDCGKYLSVMTQSSETFLLATDEGTGRVLGYVAGLAQTPTLIVDGLYADNDAIALALYSSLLDMYPNLQEIKLQEIKPRDFLSRFGEILPTKSLTYKRMARGGPAAPVRMTKLYVVCDCDFSE